MNFKDRLKHFLQSTLSIVVLVFCVIVFLEWTNPQLKELLKPIHETVGIIEIIIIGFIFVLIILTMHATVLLTTTYMNSGFEDELFIHGFYSK